MQEKILDKSGLIGIHIKEAWREEKESQIVSSIGYLYCCKRVLQMRYL
jgi:hypothetical protein